MKDIRLRIFGYAPSSAHKAAFGSWSGGPKEYKSLTIVDDDSYTHVALYYNGDHPATPNIRHIPKENVIAFMHEPYDLININYDYIKDNVGTFICHDKSKHPDLACAKEYICYLPPGIPVGEIGSCNGQKSHLMSIVASHKGFLPGHQKRHDVIRAILSTNMDIHIWGRNIQYMYRDSRVKGSTEQKPKMFAPYVFTIAIENVKNPWWLTEKYYDPILANCIPLYWGASHVDALFGTNSHITLPDDIDGIMNIIKDVYTNPLKYNTKTSADVKSQLLGEKNYQHFLWTHFNV
jgi:hypothetical protein